MLRLPSVLAGLALIALAAFLTRQLAELGELEVPRSVAPCCQSEHWWPALVAAGLIAFNELHVWNSSTARMYTFGTLFSLGATSGLVGAVRHGWSKGRTIQYVLCAVAGVYTHHFVWLIILGHWISGVLFFLSRKFGRNWSTHSFEAGLFGASVCLIGSYLPWLPVVVLQAKEVQGGFWIPSLSVAEWLTTFASAYLGAAGPVTTSLVLLSLGLAAAIRATYLKPAVGVILLPAATLTFVVLLAHAGCTGRTLLQDRYLSFCGAHWLVLLGLGACLRSGPLAGSLLTAALLLPTALGVVRSDRIRYDTADARESMCQWLINEQPLGRTVIVLEPKDVNLLRYYFALRGNSQIRVAWLRPSHWPEGHVVHVASFDSDDVMTADDLMDTRFGFWCLHSEGRSPPMFPGFKHMQTRDFAGNRLPNFIATEFAARSANQ